MYTEDILTLSEWLRSSRHAVFFGGAGVSTESGVKDYRSQDGLYATVKEYGVSPETILSRSFFEEQPEVFYDFYAKYFFGRAQPNAAHKALARLEEMGKLDAVITQNIDGLHQAGGSKNVLELHGTTFRYHCHTCSLPFPAAEVIALGGKVPHCRHCGGLVRPDIVLYEEPLNEAVTVRAVNAIASADLLLIGGTSLAVYPAAGYLAYFRGAHTVLINRDETPYDQKADLVFHESIGKVLSEAVALLEGSDAV